MGRASDLRQQLVSASVKAMIPQEFIQSLLGRVDIVDVVDRYVKLKKAGANFRACCPFHNEKTPSFTVSPTKQFYHCFGCGAHGNAIGFLMEYGGLAYPDAIRRARRDVGMPVPETRRALEPRAGRRERRPRPGCCSKRSLLPRRAQEVEARHRVPEGARPLRARSPRATAWATRPTMAEPRSVFPTTTASRWTTAGPRDRPARARRALRPLPRPRHVPDPRRARQRDRLRRARDRRGEPKYLNSPETPLFEKGRELYGLYQARRGDPRRQPVIVVEGYMDVVALAQHGVDNAVATLGTATTPYARREAAAPGRQRGVLLRRRRRRPQAPRGARSKSRCRSLADGKVVSFLFLPAERRSGQLRARASARRRSSRCADAAKPLSQFLLRRAVRPGIRRRRPKGARASSRGEAAARADRRADPARRCCAAASPSGAAVREVELEALLPQPAAARGAQRAGRATRSPVTQRGAAAAARARVRGRRLRPDSTRRCSARQPRARRGRIRAWTSPAATRTKPRPRRCSNRRAAARTRRCSTSSPRRFSTGTRATTRTRSWPGWSKSSSGTAKAPH